MRFKSTTLILSALTLLTTALALIMALTGSATWLEAVSFVTGAACVWLTLKENIWNFPIGLANVATFFVVFLNAKLFADASLQIVYFILGVIGWYLWLYGGEKHTALHIVKISGRHLAAVLTTIVILTATLWLILRHITGASPFFDALTTAISISAQWLLNKKCLENWILWIIVDAIYVPLYVYKGLYLTTILYSVFLIMAVMGYQQWKAAMRRQKNSQDLAVPSFHSPVVVAEECP